MPHHITQRGNRRQQTFFSDDDYKAYIDLMAEWCREYEVDIWAYCLMPNHIHLVAVPSKAENLRLAIGEAHRRYTRRINFSKGWRGHLWQERFSSFLMDERYLLACVRYIENNPVRAKLVMTSEQWSWSSVAAHISGKNDNLVNVAPILSMIRGSWRQFLSSESLSDDMEDIRKHERTGRPLGSRSFVEQLENKIGRILKPQNREENHRNRYTVPEILSGAEGNELWEPQVSYDGHLGGKNRSLSYENSPPWRTYDVNTIR